MSIAFRPLHAADIERMRGLEQAHVAYAGTPFDDAGWMRADEAVDGARCVRLAGIVDDAPVAMFVLHGDLQRGGAADCGLLIAPDAPISGDAALLAGLQHAFDALELRRLQCAIVASERAAIAQHLRCGFALEGIARQACLRDGDYVDVCRLSLLAADWQRHVRPALIERQGPQPNMAGRIETFDLMITPQLVDAYSAATGDDNPVHLDDEAASRQGFPGRIAHGMLLGGAFSKHFANEFPGPGTIYVSQSLQFTAPVAVGAHASVVFTVESHIGRRITVQTQVLSEGRICVDGIAVMMLPKHYRVPEA